MVYLSLPSRALPFALTSAMAFTASASIASAQSRNILGGQGVTLGAMRLASIDVRDSSGGPLHQMFVPRDGEKMRRAATQRLFAQVVQLVAVGNRADVEAVGQAVNVREPATARSESDATVAVSRRARPQPTASHGVNANVTQQALASGDRLCHRLNNSTVFQRRQPPLSGSAPSSLLT